MVKWLIDVCGCALSPLIDDKNGNSAIHLAKKRGFTKTVKFLEECREYRKYYECREINTPRFNFILHSTM